MEFESKQWLLFYLIMGGLMAFLLFAGIRDIKNSDEVSAIHVDSAVEVASTMNKISRVPIPLGMVHLYMGVNGENGHAYIIRAPKKWFTENFNTEGERLIRTDMILRVYLKQCVRVISC